MNRLACRRVIVHGVVQGVGFRYATQREAVRLGLGGWVRNRRDGTVEAVASGPPEAVDAFLAWVRHGPPSARVAQVDVLAEEGAFEDFELRPTA